MRRCLRACRQGSGGAARRTRAEGRARSAREKIKTIGDAYLAAAGLAAHDDASDAADHAAAAAALGLDMLEAVAASDSGWRIRIGIDCGPVVSGVIGTRTFAYDVWGDTVNVASRLEGSSEPGRIHVSATIATLIGDRFALEPRGKVMLKGKGAVETAYLVGRR